MIVGKVPAALQINVNVQTKSRSPGLLWSLRTRIVTILRVGLSVWHDEDGTGKSVRVWPHDKLIEPVSEDFKLLQVGLTLFGSDLLVNTPGSVRDVGVDGADNITDHRKRTTELTNGYLYFIPTNYQRLTINLINYKLNLVKLLLALAKKHTTSYNITVVLTRGDFTKDVRAVYLDTVKDGDRPTHKGLYTFLGESNILFSITGNTSVIKYKRLTVKQLLLYLVGNMKVIGIASASL